MDPVDVEMQTIHEQPSNLDMNMSMEDIANVEELDSALIRYATHSSRLLFIEREETWSEFHTASAGNSEKFNDFTTEQICDYFLRKVLPNIYNHQLTAEQKHIFELMNLHPEYERTPNGYTRMPPNRRIGFDRLPNHGVDYVMVEEVKQLRQMLNESTAARSDSSASEEFNLTKPAHSPTHTLLMRVPYERQGTGYNYEFSSENAALLSAALSNDFELSGRVLLEPREIHKRLREAKRNFEQSGRLPENLLDAKKLIEKIKKLTKLREAVVDVVANRF